MARYVAAINPDASVPGRTKVMGDIKSLSDKNLSNIRDALSRARRVSVTTDIWSSQLSTDSYIGVTVHFINTVTRKRQWLKISKSGEDGVSIVMKYFNVLNSVGCKKFNEAHKGLNIAAKLLSIFQSYIIENRVWFVLTDSGANMIKGKQVWVKNKSIYYMNI